MSTEEALKDVKPFNSDENIKIIVIGDNDKIREVQQKLNNNMDKTIKLAEKTIISEMNKIMLH